MPKARGKKAKARIDSFYEIKDKAFQKTEDKIPNLELRMSRMGGKVLEVHNINKSYGPLNVVSDFSYTFKKGERIGIVGKKWSRKIYFIESVDRKRSSGQRKGHSRSDFGDGLLFSGRIGPHRRPGAS